MPLDLEDVWANRRAYWAPVAEGLPAPPVPPPPVDDDRAAFAEAVSRHYARWCLMLAAPKLPVPQLSVDGVAAGVNGEVERDD